MFGLCDDELCKLETRWRCSVLITELHTGIVHFLVYNNTGYELAVCSFPLVSYGFESKSLNVVEEQRLRAY